MALNVGTLVAYLQLDDSAMRRGLRSTIGGAGATGRSIGSKISAGLKKTVKAGFAALAKIAKAGGLAAAAAITAVGAGAVKSAIQIDNAKRTLTGLYGSAKKAQSTMDGLRKVAADSPIDYNSYTKAAESLAYAGVQGKKATGILKNVGLAITAAGGDSQQMQGASDAVLKMVNAGKVQLDSLQQLSDNGVPILSGLAKHFGVSISTVNKMASNGKVKLDDVLSVMQHGTGKTFKSMMKAGKSASKSFGNTFKRIKDQVLTTLGTALVPVLDKLGPLMDKTFGGLKQIAGVLFNRDFTGGGPFEEDSPVIGFFFKLHDWIAKVLPQVKSVVSALWSGFVQKVLPAAVSLAKQIGSTLLPIIESLWTAFRRHVLPALIDLGHTFTDTVIPAVMKIWHAIAEYVLPVFAAIWHTIVSKVVPAVLSIAAALIRKVLPVLSDLVHSFAKNVMPSLQHLWHVISTKILPILIALAKFIATKVIPVLLHVAGPILKVVFKALGILINVLASVIGWLADHLVPGVRHAFGYMADKAKWLWHNAIQPAFHGIKAAAVAVKDKFWTVVHGIRDAYSFMKNKTLDAVKWVVDKFLWFVQKIIDGAAKAFGWVPGLGGKLKSAASHFRSFRKKVNSELDKIKDKKVHLNLHTRGISAAAGLLGGGGGRKLMMANAAGGTIPGQRAPYGDKVLSWLAPGEEVISNRHGQADKHRGLLKAINSGRYQGHADGGTVFDVGTSGLNSAAAKFTGLRVDMNKFTQKILDRLTKKAESALDFGASIGNVGGGVKRWAPLVLRALGMLGQPKSLLGAVLHRMQQESGGNPRAINNWDINAWLGHPSKGLMQTIGPTFNAYAGRFRSLGIYNPFANIYAGLNYALHAYPSLRYAMLKSGGYAHGTLNATRGWHKVGENGPEWMHFNGGETVLQNGKRPPSGATYNTTINAPSNDAQEIWREFSYGLRRMELTSAYGGHR